MSFDLNRHLIGYMNQEEVLNKIYLDRDYLIDDRKIIISKIADSIRDSLRGKKSFVPAGNYDLVKESLPLGLIKAYMDELELAQQIAHKILNIHFGYYTISYKNGHDINLSDFIDSPSEVVRKFSLNPDCNYIFNEIQILFKQLFHKALYLDLKDLDRQIDHLPDFQTVDLRIKRMVLKVRIKYREFRKLDYSRFKTEIDKKWE